MRFNFHGVLFPTRAVVKTSPAVVTLREASLADGLITLKVQEGDIIQETTDVIVNSANPELRPWSGHWSGQNWRC